MLALTGQEHFYLPTVGSIVQGLFQKADEGTRNWQNRLRKSATDDNRGMKMSKKSL